MAYEFGKPLQIRVVGRSDLDRRRLGLRRGLWRARLAWRRPGPGRLLLLSEAERTLKELGGGWPLKPN